MRPVNAVPRSSAALIAWVRGHLSAIAAASILLLALRVASVVYLSAWVSDDCLITLRYVNNTLNGYGAVFNVGEYVQGYTHPLWYVMLVAGTCLFHNEILVAIALGLALTVLQLLLFGHMLLRCARNPLAALIVFALACSVCISSDIWVSYQTGGLENALSHLLILMVVAEAFLHKGRRPGIMVLLLSLLCLSRPDYLFFSIPFGILVLPHLRSARGVGLSLLAAIPSLVWLWFARWYYGAALPNTGAAKLGIYPDWLHAVRQGALYAHDWCARDAWAAGGTAAFLVYCMAAARDKATRVVLAGIALHLAWVICIGGDFMRGRFFMPVLTAGVIIGSFNLVGRCGERPFRTLRFCLWISLGVFILADIHAGRNASAWNAMPYAGILNERRYYPGYSLRSYLRQGRLTNAYADLAFADELRAYADVCGPITIHSLNPGPIGYLAGPKVTVIDLLGLTDRFIANLPREFQISPCPRPGHAAKHIPVGYLVGRHDIARFPRWDAGVRRRDCSLRARAAQCAESWR